MSLESPLLGENVSPLRNFLMQLLHSFVDLKFACHSDGGIIGATIAEENSIRDTPIKTSTKGAARCRR